MSAVIASLEGILANQLYRDNELVKAVWLGNDIVTLFIVIPAMTGAFPRKPETIFAG